MSYPDLDELLNVLFPFAQEMLSNYGEFFPFGACMDMHGGIELVSGYINDEQTSSLELINLIIAGMREQKERKEIRAAAFCFDALTIPPSQNKKIDTICAHLELINNHAMRVYLPYRKVKNNYEYGELFACSFQAEIFI